MILKTIVTILFSPIILLNTLVKTNEPVIYRSENKQTKVSEIKTLVSTSTTQTKQENRNIATTTKKSIKKSIATSTKSVVEDKQNIQNTIIYNTNANFEEINSLARGATINILCTTKYGDLSPISGTGVVISKDGLILTNAHIAQYFLLKDFREKDYLKCVARTGSPAYPRYNLKLVYISPTWVAENKSLLKEQTPKGTGENDFAFLKITGNIDGSVDKNSFKYIDVNTREYIQRGEPVLLSSYPAGFLGGISILQDLNVTSSVTNIQDIFTFKDGSIDVVGVGGTVVSQKGSSGGLVVDSFSSLIGIISTSSDGDTTGSRGLNAITVSYISRTLQKDLGINLQQFLNSNIEEFSKKFEETNRPTLTKLITDELLRSY